MAFTIVADAVLISGDTSISRPAAVFKGGDTDDAYAIDALAIAQTAANDTAGTIIAWINTQDKTSTGAIVSFNDANVVEYIDFKVVAGKLTASCTDATVAQFVTATTSAVITPHVWTHVACVQAADGYGPHFYVNGVESPATATTTTDLNEWFNNLDGIDKGWIGASSIGGAGAVGEEFVGAISDVKYWASALTAAQILADYQGNTPASVVGRYKFDGDLINTGSEATAAVVVSDAYITPTYNEFISRIRAFVVQGTLVVADAAGFSDVNGRGSALFINAA